MVVDVVPCNAYHDLRNSPGPYEVFSAYSTHVGDDTRGQKRGKVGVVLVHGHLRDVLRGSFPECFQGLKVTPKAFLFIHVNFKLSNVVRQGVHVRNKRFHGADRVPYPGLPIQLVRVKFFEKVSRDLEETPLFVSVFCERLYQVSCLRQIRVENKVLRVSTGVLPLEGKFLAGNTGLVVSPGLFQVATEVTLREFFKARILSFGLRCPSVLFFLTAAVRKEERSGCFPTAPRTDCRIPTTSPRPCRSFFGVFPPPYKCRPFSPRRKVPPRKTFR